MTDFDKFSEKVTIRQKSRHAGSKIPVTRMPQQWENQKNSIIPLWRHAGRFFNNKKRAGLLFTFLPPIFAPQISGDGQAGQAARSWFLLPSAMPALPSASAEAAARPRAAQRAQESRGERRAPVPAGPAPVRGARAQRERRPGAAGAPVAGTAGSPAARVPVAPLDRAARDQTARQPLDAALWPLVPRGCRPTWDAGLRDSRP